MSWNKYYIFVKSPGSDDLSAILSQLNLGNYKPVEEVPLHHSNKPKTLFAGFYNGNLLIVHPDLPFHFFRDELSETEKLFARTFPQSEIAVLIENASVGLFSFAVIQNGEKIRMKDGADGEYYHDFGDLLPEETDLLSKQIFDEEEIAEMKENEMSDEEIKNAIAFEASWRVPNLLSERYLGEPASDINSEDVIITRFG
jgi:hypothetical protein